MSEISPTIDSSRTIIILPEEGLLLPVAEQAPDTEIQVDLSTASLWFKISGGFSKALVSNPQDAKGKRVLITAAEMLTALPLGSAERDWLLVDSTGAVPVTLAYGKIKRGVPSWTG